MHGSGASEWVESPLGNAAGLSAIVLYKVMIALMGVVLQ